MASTSPGSPMMAARSACGIARVALTAAAPAGVARKRSSSVTCAVDTSQQQAARGRLQSRGRRAVRTLAQQASSLPILMHCSSNLITWQTKRLHSASTLWRVPTRPAQACSWLYTVAKAAGFRAAHFRAAKLS